MARPFLLLDRDGTLIVERDYLHDPDLVELSPGAKELLAEAESLGWGVAVVTNQSGVGRGMFGLEEVRAVNQRVVDLLEFPHLTVDAFYICPHSPDDRCDCRKPAPGLAHQAAQDLDIDLASSIVVGDKKSDVGLAKAIGATSVLVKTGYGREESISVSDADHIVDDLLGVIDVLRHQANI